jgi:hypothetical protein
MDAFGMNDVLSAFLGRSCSCYGSIRSRNSNCSSRESWCGRFCDTYKYRSTIELLTCHGTLADTSFCGLYARSGSTDSISTANGVLETNRGRPCDERVSRSISTTTADIRHDLTQYHSLLRHMIVGQLRDRMSKRTACSMPKPSNASPSTYSPNVLSPESSTVFCN